MERDGDVELVYRTEKMESWRRTIMEWKQGERG